MQGISRTLGQKSILRLKCHLQKSRIFNDALSNSDSDFRSTVRFVKGIGSEKSLDMWVSCMTTNKVVLTIQSVPPLVCNLTGALWDAVSADVLHTDLLSFAKVYISIACALLVYSWPDSLPNDHWLWQNVRGSRKVRAHMHVLPQLIVFHRSLATSFYCAK